MKLLILNGPNLNLLGKREPEVYGSAPFSDYLLRLRERFPRVAIEYFQSNAEGTLIDKLHETGFDYDGIVLNAGAYTHTSAAIADAVRAITTPVVEVHISNVYARETFRHHSYLAPYCLGSIVGLGLEGYALAISFFVESHQQK